MSATARDEVRTWSVESGTLLRRFIVETGRDFRHMIGSPYHPLFLRNGTLYNAEDGSQLKLEVPVATGTFTPDGNSLIIGSKSEGLATWDLRSLLAGGRRPVGEGSSWDDSERQASKSLPLCDRNTDIASYSEISSLYRCHPMDC